MSKDWPVKDLDTARNVDYLSDIEKDIVLEVNKARHDPKKYAQQYLVPRLQHFKGNSYQPPEEKAPLTTKTGAAGVQSAIDALNTIKGVPPLKPSKGLSQAAKDHVLDLGSKGKQGSTGTDGSSFTDRINRYGTWLGNAGETMSLGQHTAPNVVQAWLISDGDSKHGLRDHVLEPNYQEIGVAFGEHKSGFKHIAVADYVKDYGAKLAWTPDQIKARLEGSPDRDDPDASNWDLGSLDIGKNASWLSGIEKDSLLELNKLRTNPSKYIQLYDLPAYKTPASAAKKSPVPVYVLARGLTIVPPGADGDRAERGESFGEWSGNKRTLKFSGQYHTGRDIAFGFLRQFEDVVVGKDGAKFTNIGLSVQPHAHTAQIDIVLTTEYNDS